MNIKSFKRLLVVLCSLTGFSWAVSACTLALLSLPNMPYPWSIFAVISHGVYFEAVLSTIIILLPVIVACLWVQGGFLRVLASYLCAFILFMMASVLVGLVAFVCIEGIPDLGVIDIMQLLRELNQASLQRDHFLYSQLGSVSVFLLMGGGIAFAKFRPANNALGNAHFASGLEIQQAKFFDRQDESIIVGKKYGVPLFSNGFEHVLVFASSGSGKTRSIGIPNLFQYPYSVVCNDVKLTMFKTTSGYREKVLGHQCYCWAPASEDRKTHRYNPLAQISDDKFQRITDIQRIAHILIPDNKKSDPIWQQASRKLFKVTVLYLLDTPDKPTTLGEINRLIKQPAFDNWLATQLEETDHLDPEFYRNGHSYLNNHEKTRSSILETFSGYFELFDDPMIDIATSASDFDLRNLRREKITIYIGFTDDDMERLSPLLTLFWQQLISVMIRNIPDIKDEPYPLLCLIDEFSSLGRIERLRRSLKLLREYRVRCVLMLQYIAQTYEQYSHDEAKAFTNIKTKIAFAAEDIHDAEYISKLLGTRTLRVTAGSASSQTQGYSESRSYNYQAVPLLRPEEVMRLPVNQSLIMRTGHAPVKGGQFVWYNEKTVKYLPVQSTFIPLQKLTQSQICKLGSIL